MTTVVVCFVRNLSDEVAGLKTPSSAANEVMSNLRRYDAVALPSPPTVEGAGDDLVYRTFEVPDAQRANDLAAVLRDANGVESAFVKPGEELP